MSEQTPAVPPAGWYPDPHDSASLRYWDGAAWTTHVVAAPPVDAAVEPESEPTPELTPVAEPDRTAKPARHSRPAHAAVVDTDHAHVPVYRRGWVLALAALVLVVVVAVVVNDRSSSTSAGAAPTTTTPAASVAPSGVGSTGTASTPATATASSPALVAGDWSATAYTFARTPSGTFSGTAALTYNGAQTKGIGGRFTFTVDRAAGAPATLTTSIEAAKPGETRTVTLVSADAYFAGPYPSVAFEQVG